MAKKAHDSKFNDKAPTEKAQTEKAQTEKTQTEWTQAEKPLTEAQLKNVAKWSALYSKAKTLHTQPYKMTAKFEKETGIEHKTLGWGYILDEKNNRLEVLFKDGIKYLISNYK